MLKRWSLLVILMLALVAFTGCSDDDDPITPPAGDTAFDVMVAAGIAYVNDSAQCPGVISAQTVFDNFDDYTVVDVRGETDFLNGHIAGAYHTTWSTFLDDMANNIPSGKPYVITCYTGQSAGHYKVAAEMMGYGDVYSLLWGMSAWNENVTGNKWQGNAMIDDALANPETTNNNGDLVEHDFPVLTESTETVVADRVEAMLAAGFQATSYAGIRDNLDDYFVLNYFGQADYEGTGTSGVPGHIPGAFQFTPYASMGADQMLNNLPTDKTIVVYCWTGQHSSQITAYLNMLGYTAKSLAYGSNNLFYSSLTGHKWNDANCMNFELEMGPAMSGDFAALVDAGDDYVNDSGDCPGVIGAQTVYDNLQDYTIIDVRSPEHWAAGHIAGAYNTNWTDFLSDMASVIPSDKPYVIACYTGQSAGHYKFAAEMMGYEDVYSLKFGMSSWASDAVLPGSHWNSTTMVDDALASPETTNNNGDLVWGSYPTTTGTVADRVAAVLANGFQATTYANIQDNLDDFFVLNYFGQADYEGTGTSGVPGHIPGAFQYTPYASLGMGEMLAYLPTDQTIVVYCWTGQHSSQITAYLNFLGYDAKSLAYGSNNLFHSSLTGHNWTVAAMNDFPLEATPTN